MTSPAKLATDNQITSTSSSDEKPIFSFLKTLQAQMTVIHHRMESISKVLNIPSCECSTCEGFVENETEKTPAIKELEPAETSLPQPTIETSLPPSNTESLASSAHEQENIFVSSDNLNAQVKLLESLSNLQASTENFESSRGEGKRGRKSKYCDAETKIVITNYAKQFGPAATARKFNIPTAVASYYYRKATNSPKSMAFKSSSNEIESSTINVAEDQVMPQSVPQVPSSSPNFLRGRGRGRPKLIGDELDAALVDFIVERKKQNPQKHYTTGTIMDLSKDYIKKNAPGLLIEDGGSVILKNTWAIKLLVRVAEREQELVTNSNEAYNPLSNLLNSFDANTTDLANIFNLVNQMTTTNTVDLFNATPKLNNSNEENRDNVENEIIKQSMNESECSSINNAALKTFLATFLTGNS